MKEILVMNDDSAEALHAAEYAFNLACLYNKNIVVANLCRIREPSLKASQVSNDPSYSNESTEEAMAGDVADHLDTLKPCPDFQPEIKRLDISAFAEQDLAAYINRQRVWILVQGVARGERLHPAQLNMQAVLNRVQCPFLLVPAETSIRPLERLAYLADLRYAHVPVINFLARMNTGNESVILAHICAKGLPDLDSTYAMDLFSNGLSRNASCDHLFFSRLRDKNFAACMDQVINGIQADMLVCVNHHYHFDQLLAGDIGSAIPGEVSVPVLVFPH
jgi:nucleotide-binding universal stress UspA family protein